MGWMHLIFTDNPCVGWYKKQYLTFLKKVQFLDKKIIKFENSTSHKYLVQKSNSLWMAK